jgi:hypothetical protein
LQRWFFPLLTIKGVSNTLYRQTTCVSYPFTSMGIRFIKKQLSELEKHVPRDLLEKALANKLTKEDIHLLEKNLRVNKERPL